MIYELFQIFIKADSHHQMGKQCQKQTLRHYKYHTDILAESTSIVKTIGEQYSHNKENI